MAQVRGIKGMNDVLPEEAARWHFVEASYARIMSLAGFREVRTPIVEPTALFVRSIGETTDIVEKEMYSFVHRGDALTLRPEGTAGAARAFVEHNVHNREAITRWWYLGPMFRAENPQRGRYRQFYQAGAEIFGDAGPACDAELIDTLITFLHEIGVRDVEVCINSLGGPDTRAKYKDTLVNTLTPQLDRLSPESQKRLGTNPLRILDSKDPRDHEVLASVPKVSELLADADRAHFEACKAALQALGVHFHEDPHLVRGLDYYSRTLFEIKGAKDKLGAGNTLIGGGRYDRMVGELGGPEVPAIGFAAGLERLLIASDYAHTAPQVDAFVAQLGPGTVNEALKLGKELRAAGVRTEVDARGASMKSQLRRANGLGARVALILGDQEVATGTVTLKDLLGHTQDTVPRAELVRIVVDRLAKPVAPTRSSGAPPAGDQP